ncbi:MULTISPECIES: HPr family phosphocarrier protein [Paenibacillus]|uniref:HPr family phosphocarrier protein n=1 Tax=Paenibacillus illinoisensis TaxID=59845 RepID=A0A2W0C2D3_9BACL|nr:MULTISPECIES: HPr family phosphocarrier protein [Paenibacillus]MCM3203298.1 HPr family phosphocarrier protein [Paenibacillus illinoisensis]PYY25987.1 Phosphocarrier protein HPr [Paenibacillus illinoisensis]WJH29390.1 HPr family phosphocarrier protein [Paenibacillus sp. CC-CFT742]
MRTHEFTIHSDFHRDDLMSISSQASRFASDISLSFVESEHEHRVDVKSLLGMALLPIRHGSIVRLQTRGRDELEALEYMLDVLEKGIT